MFLRRCSFTTSPVKAPRRKPSPPLEPTSPSIYSPSPLLFARPASPALTNSSHEVDAEVDDVFGDDKVEVSSPEAEKTIPRYKHKTASSFGTLGQCVLPSFAFFRTANRVRRRVPKSDDTSSRSGHPSQSGSSSISHSPRSASSSIGNSLSPRSNAHSQARTDSLDEPNASEGNRVGRRDTMGRGSGGSSGLGRGSEGSSGPASGRYGSSDSARGGSSGSSRGHAGWVSAEEVPPVPEMGLARA